MALKIRNLFSEKNDRWEVKLIGDVDIDTSQDLQESFYSILGENNKSIFINAEEVDYIDSTGLGMFIKILKKLKEEDNEITFVNPKKNVMKLFNITGLDKVFNIIGGE